MMDLGISSVFEGRSVGMDIGAGGESSSLQMIRFISKFQTSHEGSTGIIIMFFRLESNAFYEISNSNAVVECSDLRAGPNK
jgi:hypothetical protein